MTYFDQSEFPIRCEWGPEGIQQLTGSSDALIIVDVFSFTTAVDVALSRGARVYPYRWKDESALAYAQSLGALLAAENRRDPTGFSLSPASLTRLPENVSIVMPSPNGATLSLATAETPTFAGCLRNARAVALAAAQLGPRISVIPAGERWPDGSLRLGLEDLLGAGAILAHLPGEQSPEAEAAAVVFEHFRDRLEATLVACSSGKQVAGWGLLEDIRLTAELDVSSRAPRLIDGAYVTSPASF